MLRVLLGALLAGACGPPAPPVPPLDLDDFGVAGLPAHTDTAELRLSLGDPDSITVQENPFEAAVPLETWHYAELEVRFSGSAPIGFMLLAPGVATARGAQVGDPSAQLLRLYGAPDARQETGLTWLMSDDAGGLHAVDVQLRADTVARIYIGRALD